LTGIAGEGQRMGLLAAALERVAHYGYCEKCGKPLAVLVRTASDGIEYAQLHCSAWCCGFLWGWGMREIPPSR
jgi:RNA polymerase-binding transcription factor DksA